MIKTTEEFVRLPELVTELPVGITGMTAKLIERTDKKAIYWRWDDVWEVFRIKIDKGAEAFGKWYPAHESYPGNEDFGRIAWCFKDEKNARKRYNDIP